MSERQSLLNEGVQVHVVSCGHAHESVAASAPLLFDDESFKFFRVEVLLDRFENLQWLIGRGENGVE